MATFVLAWQSYVPQTETRWPTMPKIYTLIPTHKTFADSWFRARRGMTYSGKRLKVPWDFVHNGLWISKGPFGIWEGGEGWMMRSDEGIFGTTWQMMVILRLTLLMVTEAAWVVRSLMGLTLQVGGAPCGWKCWGSWRSLQQLKILEGWFALA